MQNNFDLYSDSEPHPLDVYNAQKASEREARVSDLMAESRVVESLINTAIVKNSLGAEVIDLVDAMPKDIEEPELVEAASA